MRQLEPVGGGPWHANFGLHAAANAINAGVPTHAETEVMFSREFNDSTVRPIKESELQRAWGSDVHASSTWSSSSSAFSGTWR